MAKLGDSVSSFKHASKHIKGAVSTEALTGQNSVWMVRGESDQKYVIKYFDLLNHDDDHLILEKSFLEANFDSDFVPRLYAVDESERFIITEWIDHEPLGGQPFEEVLDGVREVLKTLIVPDLVHNGLPGGLQSWPFPRAIDSVGEELVVEYLLQHSDFSDVGRRARLAWQGDELVHGDIRIANILRTRKGISIIDWECYLKGPQEWDVACLLASTILESMLDGPTHDWAIKSLTDVSTLAADFDQSLRDFLTFRLSQLAIDIAASSDMVPLQSAWLLDVAGQLSSSGPLDFIHVKN